MFSVAVADVLSVLVDPTALTSKNSRTTLFRDMIVTVTSNSINVNVTRRRYVQ